MTVDDDLDLLDRWCAGDAGAGNALFKRHFGSVYRFLEFKVDRDLDDLVQETFLGCLNGRDRFRRQSTFRTYLLAIARNVLSGYWRRRGGVLSDSLDVHEISVASLSTSAGTKLVRGEDRARLVAALQALPLEQQELLELYYWEDLDREQLAEVFGVETATIGTRLFRARQALLELLRRDPVGASLATEEDLDAWARAMAPNRVR